MTLSQIYSIVVGTGYYFYLEREVKGNEKMKILSFVNQKGGVGKTTSVINVGAGLALLGKRILLIDMDPSGNLTKGTGIKLQEDDSTIYEVLKGKADINDVIRKASSGSYDVVPADSLLSGANIEFSTVPGREMLLKEAVEQIRTEYDYILIDAPRTLDTVSVMTMTAADAVIVPVQAHYYALDGIAQLTETLKIVKQRMNPKLQIGGVLVTMYDRRKVSHREILETLQEAFGNKVYKTTIGTYTALSEAPSYGKDIFAFRPKDKGALQYMDLVKEIETQFT